jgi:UPF0716 protein FxsA
MRLFIGLILLAFPFAEIFLLVELAHRYGWWLLVYLVVIGYLGLQLVRGEKLLIAAKMMQSLSAGGNPVKTMLGSARNMAAGVLLMIPGVITDIVAVILLLLPMGRTVVEDKPNDHKRSQAANDDIIEGEFTRVKDELKDEVDRLK